MALFIGLPVIFHLFAHNVPVEERSRAFGYLVAAGSVGQVVASVVSPIVLLTCVKPQRKKLCFTNYIFFLLLDMSTLGMANWILLVWNNRYHVDFPVADAVSGNELSR